ncbi:MAG: UDP-N-acetylglucosamine 2-epimerase (non-hydrolyzing) [Caldilinea sp. CFX5]|nr:UDP-N-acetylglucosamine 2-epimerase (non-hydrolyzing) [Caldilinea sp. CFX5]
MHVVGARPNFMKMAPIMRVMACHPKQLQQILVHTGQHYDANMSDIFFTELGLPAPDVNLEVGSGSHAQQTAQVMQRFETVLLEYKPDWVVVPGDVNSTLACALVAAKLGVKVAHVEAGLRSFDRTMPEEINRVLTDQISDLLFTPSEDGNENLKHEGIADEKVHFVGNVMIDSLVRLLPKAAERWSVLQPEFGLEEYVLVTLHRPSNVDEIATLRELMAALSEIAAKVEVFFPVHPRTRKRILDHQIAFDQDQIQLVEPLGYLDFLALQTHARLVLTDSGGVQEETTYLGIPCLTARPNTERPVTITHGSNRLVQSTHAEVVAAANASLSTSLTEGDTGRKPPLWDGRAAERIVEIFLRQAVGVSS